MKVEDPSIDRVWMGRHLHTAYGMAAPELEFLPWGEDSYCFRLSEAEQRWFLRLQRGDGIHLPAALDATRKLNGYPGLENIVAPIPTLAGRSCVEDCGWVMALFPYFDGKSLWDDDNADRLDGDWIDPAAGVIAALHDRGLRAVPAERFLNSYRGPIEALIAAAADGGGAGLHRRLFDQIRSEREPLLEAMEELDRLGGTLRSMDLPAVVTHGDPNLANWIRTPEGRLLLVDWGGLKLGPPERDLFAFTGTPFASFLQRYKDHGGRSRFNLTAFRYYFLSWDLQEVADYGTRLMREDLAPEEQEHAWKELASYLPFQTSRLEEGLETVRRVIADDSRRGAGVWQRNSEPPSL